MNQMPEAGWNNMWSVSTGQSGPRGFLIVYKSKLGTNKDNLSSQLFPEFDNTLSFRKRSLSLILFSTQW